MRVILREDVAGLGKLGDVANVRAGYARNFLFPAGKAERATEAAVADFAARRAELEAKQAAAAEQMEAVRGKLNGYLLQLAARTSPDGNLYGSISAQNIAAALNEQKLADGVVIKRGQVALAEGALKTIGEHKVKILLRANCEADITVSVLAAAEEGPAAAATTAQKDKAAQQSGAQKNNAQKAQGKDAPTAQGKDAQKAQGEKTAMKEQQ